jgi:hypothetical protein
MALMALLFIACAHPTEVSMLDPASAPALVGHPDAAVERITPYPHLRDLVAVKLSGGDLPHATVFLVALRDGQPIDERGEAAAARFLGDAGDALRAATLDEIESAFHHFGAWPPGFDRNSAHFDKKGVGRSSYTGSPFELVLIASADDGFGGHTAPSWDRATLRRPDGTAFTWTFDHLEGGQWATTGTRPFPEIR